MFKRQTVIGRDPLMVRDATRGALDIGPGELVVLLGASGQGKTTWIRSLLGLERPFDTASSFGKVLTRERIPEVLSWVPQSDGVFLSDTVWANVAAPRHVARNDPAHAADALDLVGLYDRAGDPVSHLGLGARRRVALARAIARRRPLLVVDGELDPTVWSLWPALRSRLPWLEGTLVAASTADDMARRADSVALVEDGAVVGQAPLSMLEHSRDAQVRSVMAWVTP